ncbi:MAG: terminase small subunit [Clostridia bacterium]|nr:terminase small subunit [Clostridia bacterium]
MSLNKRETDFCRFFVACRNSREAAAKAGFAFPERSGIRLLDKQAVIDEIDRLSEQVRTAVSAVDGLKRIAFGSVADAVKLVLHPDTVEPEALDLFMVSELKCTDKGVEVKFFDRIKALTALLQVTDSAESNETSRFVEAIFKGASAIEGLGRSVSDEV